MFCWAKQCVGLLAKDPDAPFGGFEFDDADEDEDEDEDAAPEVEVDEAAAPEVEMDEEDESPVLVKDRLDMVFFSIL